MLGHVQNHYDTGFSGYSPENTALQLNMLGTSPKCTPGHVYLKECKWQKKTFDVRTLDKKGMLINAFSTS